MSSSMKRIGAILIKETQDIRTNANVTYMYAMPVLLTVLWDRFIPDMPQGFALAFGLMFLVVMVGMYVPSMIIAEEKEKHTLEVLMLSPATPVEVFTGKGILTLISIMVTAVILILITGTGAQYLGVIFVGMFIVSIFAILLGMIVGILAQNQMSTGIIGLPIYLVLLLAPQFSGMGSGIMDMIAKFLPTYHFLHMLRMAIDEGLGLESMLGQLGVLAASAAVSFVVLLILYRKKGIQ